MKQKQNIFGLTLSRWKREIIPLRGITGGQSLTEMKYECIKINDLSRPLQRRGAIPLWGIIGGLYL